MASGVRGDVVAGDVIAVAFSEVALSRTRNHRRDQCLVSGGAKSNVHAPANETVPTINNTASRTAAFMSVLG